MNLYYTIDSGVNWILVDSNIVANLGTYKWKLPNRNSTKVLVKLVYTSDTSIIDYSDKTFTIIDKELSFDLDKTNWIKNSVNQIGWKSLGVDSLRISYKEKDSTRWISLPNIVATNSEKYNWSMPSIVSNMIEIKITDNYDSLFGIQDTILLKEKINIPQSQYKFKGGKFDGNSFKSNINKIIINKPLANEVLISGKPYTVNWDYLNLNDTVLLQYSTDSGKNWINIEKVSALLKTYEWIIPLSYNSGNVTQSGGLFGNNYSTANYINSDQCMIRVLDIKAGNEVVGISKGIFSIKPDGVLVKSVVKFDTIADIKWTGSILYKKLTATTNSNTTVKYFISSASNASIKNDTLIINGPGLINIGCYDSGGVNFSKSDTVFQKFCVIPITPVISRDVNNYLNSSALIGNKWYNSSILISDTTQSIKPTTNGSYTVNTIQGGCPSGISSPYYYIVTDIIVLNESQYISVNPNPFVDQIVLRFNLNGYSNLNLDVIEMNTGKRLFRKSNLYSGEKIHLDQLITGYYLFIISSKDTKHSYKFKLMKL